MDIQKEREKFEKHASKFFTTNEAFENDGENYIYDEVKFMWDCWLASKSQAVPECKWIADENGIYDTGCRNKFVLNCDTPHKNGMFHCCYCGGKLIEAQEQSHE